MAANFAFLVLVCCCLSAALAAENLCKLHNLALFEEKIFSQNGEDGVLLRILEAVGVTNRYYAEFGVQDGSECNSRILRERLNFTGLMMDGSNENPALNLKREFVTVDNVIDLFREHGVPQSFDLLSVDIDSFDWWMVTRLLRDGQYRPRVIIVETNPSLGVGLSDFRERFAEANAIPLTMIHPHLTTLRTWDLSRYHGANPLAFQKLGNMFGYEMVYCEMCGVNCILVHRDALPASCASPFPMPAVHYPCFGTARTGGAYPGHEVDQLMRRPVLLTDSLLALIATKSYSFADITDSLYAPNEEYPLWGADWCTRLVEAPASALTAGAGEQGAYALAVQLFQEHSYERAGPLFEGLADAMGERCASRHQSEDSCAAAAALAHGAAVSLLHGASPDGPAWARAAGLLQRSVDYVRLGRGNSRIKAMAALIKGLQDNSIYAPVTTWFSFIREHGAQGIPKTRIDMDVCADPAVVAKEYCISNNIPEAACATILSRLQESYRRAYVQFPKAFFNVDHARVLDAERLEPLVHSVNSFNPDGCLRAPSERHRSRVQRYCESAKARRPLVLLSGLSSEMLLGAAAVVLRAAVGAPDEDTDSGLLIRAASDAIDMKNISRAFLEAFGCQLLSATTAGLHAAVLDKTCLSRVGAADVSSDAHALKVDALHRLTYSALRQSADRALVLASSFLPFTQSFWRSANGEQNDSLVRHVLLVPPIEMAVNSLAVELNLSPEETLPKFIELTNSVIGALAADSQTGRVTVLTLSGQDSDTVVDMLQGLSLEHILKSNSTKFKDLMTLLHETIPLSLPRRSIQIPYWFYKCYESIRTMRIFPKDHCVE